MLERHWNILVVDDDADVLAVTRLALKRMTCYGLPVKLHECASKQSAIEFLKTNPEAERLAIAMIDVVMENDTAGLELCDVIRKEMKNHVTRLVVRTGQAGKAPEREVVDRYDITGYLPKTDATDDRLYSVVKCCVREYFPAAVSAATGAKLAALLPAIHSAEELRKRHKHALERFSTDREGRRIESMEPNHAWLFEDVHIGTGVFEDEASTRATYERLMKMPGEQLNRRGDRLMHDKSDGSTVLHLAGDPEKRIPEAASLWTTAAWPSPQFGIQALHTHLLAVRPIWMLATRRG